MPLPAYTTALQGVSGGLAVFAVTRTEPADRRIVEWVVCSSFDADGTRLPEYDNASAVKWGTWDSLQGTASVAVGGDHASAYLMIKGKQIGDDIDFPVEA